MEEAERRVRCVSACLNNHYAIVLLSFIFVLLALDFTSAHAESGSHTANVIFGAAGVPSLSRGYDGDQ
jgi:hypothetical protein